LRLRKSIGGNARRVRASWPSQQAGAHRRIADHADSVLLAVGQDSDLDGPRMMEYGGLVGSDGREFRRASSSASTSKFETPTQRTLPCLFKSFMAARLLPSPGHCP
jgi:hypothetical protein